MKVTAFMACCLAVASSGQPVAPRVTTPGDRDLLTKLVAAEDSRLAPGDGDIRREGLASANPFVRAFTVRGIGRLEQPATFGMIAPLLRDASAEVRAAAADA